MAKPKRSNVEPGAEAAWQKVPASPNCVTIFGAGVAGLTAAHELVERGFRVQIWEPVGDVRFPHRGPDIGGLARTQWARASWKQSQSLDQFDPLEPEPNVPPRKERSTIGTEAVGIVSLPQRFAFVRDPTKLDGWKLTVHAHGEKSEAKPVDVGSFLDELKGEGRFIFRIRDFEPWYASLHERVLLAGVEHLTKVLEPERIRVDYPGKDPRCCTLTWLDDNASVELEIAGTGPTPYGASTFGRIEYKAESDASRSHLPYLTLDQAWEPGAGYGLALAEPEAAAPKAAAPKTAAPEEATAVRALKELVETLSTHRKIEYVYVEACDRDFARLDDAERRARADLIATKFQEWLKAVGQQYSLEKLPEKEKLSKKSPKILYELKISAQHRVLFEVVTLHEFPTDVEQDLHLFVGFRVRERWLPGEHGYRLFPNCYRHLFDTMKRTPILDTVEKTAFAKEQERAAGVSEPEKLRYVETGRTVFDNIKPTTTHLLAFESGGGPSVLSRSKLKSLDEIRQLLHIMFGPKGTGAFEVSERDALRLSLKMIQYITSCPKRRDIYEKMSWWEFVDGDSYGENLGNFLEVWPEALVAMDAKSADARSHGDSLIQVTLDQFRDEGFRDGTLRGPVSEAWFRYWRRYLEGQGVEFLHGKLEGFEVKLDEHRKPRVWPQVACYEPRHPVDAEGRPALMPGYFVLAVSADQAKDLAEDYLAKVAAENRAPEPVSDLARASKFDKRDIDKAQPESDFRHFAGLQFYFAEDLFWADGHVYYPDSPWGLSSVSQARFWDERTDWEHGFRGILSVIVASWDEPAEGTGKKAWDCAPAELAAEVWSQIKRAVEQNRVYRRPGSETEDRPSEMRARARFGVDERLVEDVLPEPLHWRLDSNLVWDEKTKKYTNNTPFHIAAPGKYRDRPGDPVNGYQVENGIVMCGMHTQTFFRIPTMEAANESARHAVNAILNHAKTAPGGRFRRTLCQIWDPEQFEFEGRLVDFQALKDLDDMLVKRGLPHFMEILELDQITHLTLDLTQPFFNIKALVQIAQAVVSGVTREVRHGA